MKKGGGPVKAPCAALAHRPIATPMDAKTDRERRLAEQLRANLHRRKAQARAAEEQDARPAEPSPRHPGESRDPSQRGG
jgi:hypothetical protein